MLLNKSGGVWNDYPPRGMFLSLLRLREAQLHSSSVVASTQRTFRKVREGQKQGRALCLGGGVLSLALPRALGMSDVPHLREDKTRDSLPYKGRMWASKEVPDLRCWCPGNQESLSEGKSVKPGLSPAVTHITSGCGDVEFSTMACRRVLGETRASPGPLEVVGAGGVPGKDAKCPIRTCGMGWVGGGSPAEEVWNTYFNVQGLVLYLEGRGGAGPAQ